MSRGFGWLQRRLLEELSASNEPMNIPQLAGAIFSLRRDNMGNFNPSRSQRVGIHRALTKLADVGVIHRLNRWFWGSSAALARWQEEHRPSQERREMLQLVSADMQERYGLRLSAAEVEKLYDKYS